MDKDIQKILEMFRLKHAGHNLDCQTYYETCPMCQLIVDEQTDKYLNAIEESFHIIVGKHWMEWEQNGYAIANEIQPETLSAKLAMNSFEHWLQPRYHEIDISDEELLRHFYVQQKIMGN